MYKCAWEYVFKNHGLFFSEAKKNNNEFKGDRDDEGIILFWNIHERGSPAGRAAMCSVRGEYRATIWGDWWTLAHTHTHSFHVCAIAQRI